MGAGLCKPTCMKAEHGTVVSVKSRCFEKPIRIYISDEDDDALEHIEAILGFVHQKKKALRESKNDSE